MMKSFDFEGNTRLALQGQRRAQVFGQGADDGHRDRRARSQAAGDRDLRCDPDAQGWWIDCPHFGEREAHYLSQWIVRRTFV